MKKLPIISMALSIACAGLIFLMQDPSNVIVSSSPIVDIDVKSVNLGKTEWKTISSDIVSKPLAIQADVLQINDEEVSAESVALKNAISKGETVVISIEGEAPINLNFSPAATPLAVDYKLTAITQGDQEAPVSLTAPEFFNGFESSATKSTENAIVSEASLVFIGGNFRALVHNKDGGFTEIYRQTATNEYIAKTYPGEIMGQLDKYMDDTPPTAAETQPRKLLRKNTFTGAKSLDSIAVVRPVSFSALKSSNPPTGLATAADNKTMKKYRGGHGEKYRNSLVQIRAAWVVKRRHFSESPDTPITDEQFLSGYRQALTWLLFMNRRYERMNGYSYQVAEIITLLDDKAEYPSNLDVGSWIDKVRPKLNYDLVNLNRGDGGGGLAYQPGRTSWVSEYYYLAHETAHNLSGDHCSTDGGKNTTFRGCGDYSADEEVNRNRHSKAELIYRSNFRFSQKTLRDPTQAPFGVDDAYFTPLNTSIVFDPTQNDVREQYWNPKRWRNDRLTVEEMGSIYPANAGKLSQLDDNQLEFIPATGFKGTVLFNYTVRGSVGNEGKGWLHNGYVQIVVDSETPESKLPADLKEDAQLAPLVAKADFYEYQGQTLEFNPLGNDIGMGGNINNAVHATVGVNGDRYFDKNSVGFHVVSVVNLTPGKGTLVAETKPYYKQLKEHLAFTGIMRFTAFSNATGIARILYEVEDGSGRRASQIITINLDAAGRPVIADKEVTIPEYTSPGQQVAVIASTEKDLQYRIENGNYNQWFTINQKTGAITVRPAAIIKRKQQVKSKTNSFNPALVETTVDHVTLKISAKRIKGNPVRTGFAELKINLQEKTNQPPQIASAQPLLVQAASSRSTIVGKLSASDKETDAFAFTIASGNDGNTFKISSTGEISVNDATLLTSGKIFTLVLAITETRSGGNVSSPRINIHVIEKLDTASNGLLAHWSFDKHTLTNNLALDSIAQRHLATSGINSASHVTGMNKEAVSLGRNRSFLDATKHKAILGALDKGTIATWVKSKDGLPLQVSNKSSLFFASNYDDKQAFRIRTTVAGLEVSVRVDNVEVFALTAPVNINDGQWHHVAVSSDGIKTRLYVDGKVYETPSLSTQTSPFLSSLKHISEINIGRAFDQKTWQRAIQFDHGSDYLYALLDDYRIYNRALSLAEIKALIGKRSVKVVGGTGSGLYDVGDTVTITSTKSGFSAWAGSISVAKRFDKTSSFVMPHKNVQIEALTKNDVSSRGLVAHWPMEVLHDGKLTENGPHKLNSTVTNCSSGATLSSGEGASMQGKHALQLENSCYVKMGLSDAQIAKITSSASIGMWVKPKNKGRYETFASFGSKSSWVGVTEFSIGKSGIPFLYVRQHVNGSSKAVLHLEAKSNITNDGKWHHIAVVSGSNGGTRLYVDGILEATHATPIFMSADTLGHSTLGAFKTTRLQSIYTGLMDDVRLYNVELSEDELNSVIGARTLVVSNGTGSGRYMPGDTVNAVANNVAGHYFSQWKGSIEGLNRFEKTVSFKMGLQDRSLIPNYLPGSKSLDQGLVAHWPLDERSGTKVTEVASAKHGVYINDISTKSNSAAAVRNYGVSVQSSADKFYANVTNAVPAFKDLTEGSIMGWVRIPKDDTGNFNMLSASSSRSWCEKFNLDVNSGKVRLIFDCPDGRASSKLIVSDKSINDGEWHHIAATVKNNETILYIDGVQDKTNTNSTFFKNARIDRAYIGVQLNGNSGNAQGKYWQGSIDDVRVYNRAVSSTDVRALATYVAPAADKYRLTIEGGSGSGEYSAGQSINISASNSGGQAFVIWQGDISVLASPAKATATIVMPAANVHLKALSAAASAADSDNDGLSDYQEAVQGTDPNVKDTDNDGLDDKAEVDAGLNPVNPDTDGDGVNDKQELDNKTNPKADDQPPVIQAESVAIVSTGALTPYVFKGVYAEDAKDGNVAVTLATPGPYKTGRHSIRWTAVDKQKNTGTLTRILDVYPTAQINSIPAAFGGGKRIKMSVSISGIAPQYPASINVEVAPSSTLPSSEYRFVNNTVTITSGRTGYFEVELLDVAASDTPKSLDLRVSAEGTFIAPQVNRPSQSLVVHKDTFANSPVVRASEPPLTEDEKRGLVLHWPLNEISGTRIIDATGNGNDGTSTEDTKNSVSTGAFGYSYQGNSERSILGNEKVAPLINSIGTSTTGTITVWVKLNPNNTSKQRIFSTSRKEDKQNKFELLAYPNGTLGIDVGHPNFSGRGTDFDTGVNINDGKWHLFAMSMENAGGKMIVDGLVVGDSIPSGDRRYLASANFLTLGSTVKYAGVSVDSFILRSQIDDFRIYDRALSESELKAMYDKSNLPKVGRVLLTKSIGNITSEAGTEIAPGAINRYLKRNVALLNRDSLKAEFKAATGKALDETKVNLHKPLDGYYDFSVSRLNGQHVSVIIPLQTPLAAETKLLLLNNSQKWLEFEADGSQKIKSAAMVDGQCPDLGNSAYSQGLKVGHKCIELVLQNNGLYDRDSAAKTLEVLATLSSENKRYTLRVANGSGSELYPAKESIQVVGKAPKAGLVFATWTGDIAKLDNVKNETATLIMPSSDVSLVAVYNESGIAPPITVPPVETPPVVTPPVITPPVVTPPVVTLPSSRKSRGGSLSWADMVFLLMMFGMMNHIGRSRQLNFQEIKSR